MMTMAQVENQVDLFSFEEQLHLLAYIANKVNELRSEKPKSFVRRAGVGKDSDFYMSPDFDEPLEDFAEYM